MIERGSTVSLGLDRLHAYSDQSYHSLARLQWRLFDFLISYGLGSYWNLKATSYLRGACWNQGLRFESLQCQLDVGSLGMNEWAIGFFLFMASTLQTGPKTTVWHQHAATKSKVQILRPRTQSVTLHWYGSTSREGSGQRGNRICDLQRRSHKLCWLNHWAYWVPGKSLFIHAKLVWRMISSRAIILLVF